MFQKWQQRFNAWLEKTQADYEQAYDERFPGTPYNMCRAEEDEKATRSTAYWQKKYQESKKK